VHGQKEFLQKCVTVTADNTIKQCAADKNDYRLLGIIGDQDLRAKEARYHASCRKEYARKETGRHHSTEQSELSCSTVKAAHTDCFSQLCDYIQQQVVNCGHVVRMSMLRDRYIDCMQQEHPDSCN